MPDALDEELARLELLLGSWPARSSYAQWTLQRLGPRAYRLVTIDGDSGYGDTRLDAVRDVLAKLT
jgi:pimeloyl-ACP methyl ester carboxylesterase